MTKLEIARKRVAEILCESMGREYTLESLLWNVNWALDLDDMLSISTLRRACADLPGGCISRGKHKQLVIHARHFAPRQEVVAALKALDLYDTDMPVLIERQRDDLRRELLLADGRALYQSLEWAKTGAFEITYTYYGTMIRWEKSA